MILMEGPWRGLGVPGGPWKLPEGSLGGPWRSLKVPRGFSSGSLKVPGAPGKVSGGSLDRPWGITGSPNALFSEESLGVPYTNLVQSVQFSCSKHRWGSSGSNTTGNRSYTRISHFPMILRESPWRVPGGPWRSLEAPWRVPGGRLKIPKGPLEAP